MDFERFNWFAVNDRAALVTALELLTQNGRRVIQDEEPAALISACVASLGGFYTKEKLCEVVTVCKALAELELPALVSYIRRSQLDIKAPGEEEAGICPICGCELEYGDDIPLDNGGVYEWTCPGCGATGKEGYDKVFDKHYEVRDENGKPFSLPAKQQ